MSRPACLACPAPDLSCYVGMSQGFPERSRLLLACYQTCLYPKLWLTGAPGHAAARWIWQSGPPRFSGQSAGPPTRFSASPHGRSAVVPLPAILLLLAAASARLRIPALAEYLAAWRKESPYASDDDWVFPSFRNKGKTPRSGSSLVTDHIKAAAIRAGVIKKGDKRQFGLHNVRHSLATSLISWGLDFKTVHTLLRHANPTTTLAIYAQGIDANRLAAQGAMRRAVLHPVSDVVQ